MRFESILAALVATSASTSATALPNLRSPFGSKLPSRHHARSTGSGPSGFLAKDESSHYWTSHTESKLAAAVADYVVLDASSNPANGRYSGACLNVSHAIEIPGELNCYCC
jgi:hypothetical protein